MRLKGLMEPLIASKELNCIIENINKNKLVEIEGVGDSSKSYFINGIFNEINKPMVIITGSDMDAKNLYEDLNFYSNDVYYFPNKEVVFYNIHAISGDLRWARLKVIKEILSNKKIIIITSIDSFAAQYSPKDLYLNHQIKLKVSDEVDFSKLSRMLVEGGYERVEMVEGKGEFALRGGLLDVFPIDALDPYRIELFGDEIDTIRTFNISSQRSIENVEEIDIFPAKEVVLNDELINNGLINMEKSLDRVKEAGIDKDIEAKIRTLVNRNIEELKETGNFEIIESFMPFFYDTKTSLFDYLEDYIFVIDEKVRALGKLDSTYFEFNQNVEIFLERGDILSEQAELLFKKEEVLSLLTDRLNVSIEEIKQNSDLIKPKCNIDIVGRTLNDYKGQLDYLINDIKSKKDEGYRTVILAGTRPRGERLVDTLRDRDIESCYKDKIDEIQCGEVVITFGNLLNGFEIPEYKICVISDKEVFGEAKRKLAPRKTEKKGVAKIKSFTDLKPGDYVVHVNHGIGIYKGIKQIEVSGHRRDYLDIIYDKGDKLYVPVDQLDLVQKYIGSEGKNPKVNKLGGNEWQKAKSKVRKSINEIAEGLVKLYATRSMMKGFKYSKDTEWQRQFEDEFPYQETPDQLTSLEDIKKDMESDKAMDRLLCGDVGYGKTEVALRAAFKAVVDGKQVAFLVPTTILAEQHYKNMVKRFSDFPVKIDMISRFRTAKQQKATLQAAKEGNVDILVGTHKLVSKDIEFKDLGLLIVDEEQRFGVAQKEKIKNIKKNIDVLTLSATPIPRTLHMSLTGVRDISVIETPPEERYPIQTYVVEQNDQLIRDAIMRELSRGGQVYFVYNRVENIDKVANYIKNLVPESKVTVVHGQMTERQLEKEMAAFMEKEYNVLVCTTIIETGIDIQNVNTIIVYDADKMGLSQLYQLRGRVGRSNRIAYAYLLYTKDKILTEVAEKRLKALKDFTELGSGFKIAMRDLEIRGAGNMMGASQHGHMATVGYDLYCRMLEDTVKLIKGEIDKEPIETTIELKVDAFISSDYISDEIQKIEVYKKIASIEKYEDYEYIKEELNDRFSDIPEEVINLMDIAYIKSLARQIDIEEIKQEDRYIILKFAQNTDNCKKVFNKIFINYKDKAMLQFGEKPSILLKGYEPGNKILDELKGLLLNLLKM